MYAVPAFEPDIFLIRVVDDRREDVPPAAWSPRVRREWRAYRTRRTHLGQLTGRPDDLGRALLADHGEGKSVAVLVQLRRIDRESARVQADREEYRYSP
jgi:hypothetical protein